jgi:DNA-binding protein HU-beta
VYGRVPAVDNFFYPSYYQHFQGNFHIGQGHGDAVIKLDIINEVVHRTGITKTKAEAAVETVFESMKRALAQGDRIELRGFGVFNVRPRKTGIGRNPRTGAEVSIPPGKAVRFKPGKELQSID